VGALNGVTLKDGEKFAFNMGASPLNPNPETLTPSSSS